jgi:multiple antibiotic resistance protein
LSRLAKQLRQRWQSGGLACEFSVAIRNEIISLLTLIPSAGISARSANLIAVRKVCQRMTDMLPIIKSAIGIIAIVNPPVAIPVFLSLTTGQSPADRRHTAKVAAVAVFLVLIVAALVGAATLGFLGIRISSFRVAGGILLLLMAIAMLHAHPTGSRKKDEEIEEATAKDQIGVVPLAMPILAGPGAISLVILDFQLASDWFGKLGICTNIAIVSILVWATLSMAERIGILLGKTGINIVTRLMGLLLAALAVELTASGIADLFPTLKNG